MNLLQYIRAAETARGFESRKKPQPYKFSIGDPVTVDGFVGRGVITKVTGNRVEIQFRSGQTETRDVAYVHLI